MRKIFLNFGLILLLAACTGNESHRIPVIGKTFLADFDLFKVKLRYQNDTLLSFAIVAGKDSGHAETVRVNRVAVRPDVYLVSWQEQSKTTVVHLEDYGEGKVYSKSTTPALELSSFRGSLKSVE